MYSVARVEWLLYELLCVGRVSGQLSEALTAGVGIGYVILCVAVVQRERVRQ